MLKFVYLALLFPTLLNAADFDWPNHFEGERSEPSKSKIYGCLGGDDLHFLTLDFENKIYVETDVICHAGDMHFSGNRGVLELVENRAFKIITEVGDKAKDEDEMVWRPIEVPVRDGHFIYVPDQHFDEYDSQGNFFTRW